MGLTFILDVDELLYQAMLPMPLKALFQNLAPLEKYGGFCWKHAGWPVVANIAIGFATCIMVLYFEVLKEFTDMHQIRKHLCDGNLDFVVDINFQSNQLFSVKSVPVEPNDALLNEMTHRRKAVRELIDSSNIDEAKLSAAVRDLSTFEQSTVQTMYQKVGMARYCIDNPRIEKFKDQFRAMTGIKNGSQCVDFKDHCGIQSMRDLRLMCSVTCGCADPLSGLFFEGPTEGCPRDICRSTPRYRMALATRECRDLSLAELQAMPAWAGYFEQYFRYHSAWMPTMTAVWNRTRTRFIKFGCNALKFQTLSNNGLDLISFCEDTNALSSVRSFCPVTCGCPASKSSNCPVACALQQNATT